MKTISTSGLIPYTSPGASDTNKASLFVPLQLPEFVRDNPNYENYVLFIKAYYEWMEQQGNTSYYSKGMPEYKDVDYTLDQFIQHFVDEFLPFFPKSSLVDKRKLIKVAKELYQTKGTPASYEFLFRILYNSDVNLFNSQDYIFKASAGQWITTRSLKLNTVDLKWLQTVNYKIFGEKSKSYAEIENVIVGDKDIKIILANIQGEFLSGEYVYPVNVHGQKIFVDDILPRARILGTINSIKINKKSPGLTYIIGDPVIITGGLDPEIGNAGQARAAVSNVTKATVTGVTSVYPGHGYRKGQLTRISLISPSGAGAKSEVKTLNDIPYVINLVPNDTIQSKANTRLNANTYGFSNLTSSNISTSLIEAFTFPTQVTYGIESVEVLTTGTGYDGTTLGEATGLYYSDVLTTRAFSSLGILSPVTIIRGGKNYNIGDELVFTGGSGYGAWGRVTSIDSQFGAITGVEYIPDPTETTNYPLGGMGYLNGMPAVTVTSTTGVGAELIVNSLLGRDADFLIKTTPYGQILEIELTNTGLNYVSTPAISLRIQDILIANTDPAPEIGDLVFQGEIDNPTWYANVFSSELYSSGIDTMRVYDYNGIFDINTNINLRRGELVINDNVTVSNTTTGIYTNGRKIYGNGGAKANAIFSNGITLDAGVYGNDDGQPSSYSILKNETYNEFTYLLQVEKALSTYKTDVLDFLHPAGLKYVTYNMLKGDANYNLLEEELEATRVTEISELINVTDYTATFANNSSNTIVFGNLNGANIANVITTNSFITIHTSRNATFTSEIKSTTANTITFVDEWVTLFPNVATANATAGSDAININELTKSWTIATGNAVTYFSDFMNIYDYVSFDGINFKMITHVDQPSDINGEIIIPNIIRVNSSFTAANSGYLTLRQSAIFDSIYINSDNI